MGREGIDGASKDSAAVDDAPVLESIWRFNGGGDTVRSIVICVIGVATVACVLRLR